MRGEALVWSGRLEKEECFKKRKRKKSHSMAVWRILLSSHPLPPPVPLHPPGHELTQEAPGWCTPDHSAWQLPILPLQPGQVPSLGAALGRSVSDPAFQRHFLSKRKAKMPLQRRAERLSESAILERLKLVEAGG